MKRKRIYENPVFSFRVSVCFPGKNDTKDVDAMAAPLKKGMFNAGAFQTSDCHKNFEELKAKGVGFVSEPKDQFYGVESVFKDPFGNWFSTTRPKNY